MVQFAPVKLPPAERYAGLASVIIACESACSFTGLLESGRIRELKQQDEFVEVGFDLLAWVEKHRPTELSLAPGP